MARGLRRSRAGRVTIAVRENERAARVLRRELAHGDADGLRVLGLPGRVRGRRCSCTTRPASAAARTRRARASKVFSMAVIGGLGSVPGAVLGATYVRGVEYYLAPEWRFLATGAGLLIVLMILPGGLGAALGGRARLVAAPGRPPARHRHARARRPAERSGRVAPAARRGDALRAAARRGPAAGAREPARLGARRRRRLRRRPGAVRRRLRGRPTGEVVALLGTNGAGKSTLLRAIDGALHPPRAARSRSTGVDTTKLPSDRVAQLGVAVAPGGRGVFPSLTVGENLRLADVDAAAAIRRRAAPRATRPSSCSRRSASGSTRPAGDLSGGQQQMLTLAMAFAAPPAPAARRRAARSASRPALVDGAGRRCPPSSPVTARRSSSSSSR